MTYHGVTLFLACIAFSPCLVTADIMKLHFPYAEEEDLFPRVKIGASFKSLPSFTLCLWAKSNGKGSALFSYGVPGQDSEISLSLRGSVLMHIGGRPILEDKCDDGKPVYWILGAWHHICVTWTGTSSFIRSYVNGYYCSRSATEVPYHVIQGNGVMILGQALKGLDSGFHKNESWTGDIAGVQMWDEVLTYEQIVNLGRCNGNLEGNIVSWKKTPMLAFDGVILDRTNVCNVLGKTDVKRWI